MDKLKELYYDFVKCDEYCSLEQLPEVAIKEREMYNILEDKLGREEFLETESSLVGLMVSSEMQGWVYGFKYAMSIISACGIKNEDVA